MKILIAGSSGLLGSNLRSALNKEGHFISRLVRHPAESFDEVSWDPDRGIVDLDKLSNFDAVVNLAGESIANGKWTEDKKNHIFNSRIVTTQFLSKCLAAPGHYPKILINASAVGYYGDRGAESLTEDSPPGASFLSGVCKAWEEATRSAEHAGVRVVKLRTGVVLSKDGGALQRILIPFKLGLGGPLGSGRQYLSWISMRDEIAAIIFCINNNSLSGAVNLVAPHPVTSAEFARTLGQVLSRPAILPAPSFALKFLMGEMAEELLLGGARVEPYKLLVAGFKFQDPQLVGALRNILT